MLNKGRTLGIIFSKENLLNLIYLPNLISKNFIYLLIFFLSITNLHSQSNGSQEEDIIEWSDVKASNGYQIQIRNTKKKVIIDEKILDTKYKVQLPEGIYELRIGVYNKFLKIIGYSEWEKITIKKVLNPIVSGTSEAISEDLVANKPIKILGDNFTSDTKIEIQTGSEKILPDEILYINEKELDIVFKRNIPQGSYDLFVINPRNKKSKKENYLTITKPKEVAEMNAREPEQIAITTEPEEKKKMIYEFSFSNTMRSAILPGWGQYNKNEKLKSLIIGSVFLTGGAYYNSEIAKYRSSLNKYNSDANLGLLYAFSTPVFSGRLVALNYFQNTQNLSRAESQLNTVNQIGLGLQLFYLYNLIDASIVGKNKEKEQGLRIFAEETLQVYSPGFVERGMELGLRYNF